MQHLQLDKQDDVKIFFSRHAQSIANVSDYKGNDAPLTVEGRNQSSRLNGHYDLIVISPMRRCFETLLYSDLTYSKVIVNHKIREIINNTGNCLPGEDYKDEEDNNTFWNRCNNFTKDMEEYCKEYKKYSYYHMHIFLIHGIWADVFRHHRTLQLSNYLQTRLYLIIWRYISTLSIRSQLSESYTTR